MSAKGELLNAALEIATDALRRANARIPEQLAARSKQQEIEYQLEAARISDERARSFKEALVGDELCPRCWVLNGLRTKLTTTASGDRQDNYQCRACGYAIVIDA